MKSCKTCVIQLDSKPGDVATNREKVLQWCRKGIRTGAKFILFHEVALTDYCENISELAEKIPGPTTNAIRDLLEGTDSYVIIGLAEKRHANLYDSVVIVSADGICGRYAKTHLWPSPPAGARDETAFYRPGREFPIFQLDHIKVGLMICFDGFFPEVPRILSLKGAEIIFYPNNRGGIHDFHIQAMALLNGVEMAISNRAAYDPQIQNYGNSMLVNRNGQILAKLPSSEGMIVDNLFPGLARQERENLDSPPYQSIVRRRPEIYGFLTGTTEHIRGHRSPKFSQDKTTCIT